MFVKKPGLADIFGNTHKLSTSTVGAVIDRPRGMMFGIWKCPGEYGVVFEFAGGRGIFLHGTARAVDDRPYKKNTFLLTKADKRNKQFLIQNGWLGTADFIKKSPGGENRLTSALIRCKIHPYIESFL